MSWFSDNIGPATGVAGSVIGSIVGGPLGGIIGGGIGGAFGSAYGQAEANRENIALAREQMAFQERMSNTSHQREVADLRAAGINPVLSANSGASTPAGALATVQNDAPDFSAVLNSAIQLRKQSKEFEQMGIQNNLLKNQIEKLNVDKEYSRQSAMTQFWESKIAEARAGKEWMSLEWDKSNPESYHRRKWFESLNPLTQTVKDGVVIGGSAYGLSKLGKSGGRSLNLNLDDYEAFAKNGDTIIYRLKKRN